LSFLLFWLLPNTTRTQHNGMLFEGGGSMIINSAQEDRQGIRVFEYSKKIDHKTSLSQSE